MLRKASLPAVASLVLLGALALPTASAYAATVSRAELKGGQLRLDGVNAAPGIFVMVRSSSSLAGARSDGSGAYHVQAANFRADDCQVVVSDGFTPSATVTLSGCTPTPVTPPSTTPAPSGTCVIVPGAPATYNVGDLSTYYFATTGCDTSARPVTWSFLAGRIPLGMSAPFSQGQTAGSVSGRPATEGTYSFTVGVTDSTGATDAETFTITVAAPRPVTINSLTTVPGTVGHSYWIILTADGGMPYYTWALRSGALPTGLSLTSNGSIAGTTTTRGTFSFTVAATDSRGTTALRTLSITVS
jgi:Putative Ig domain